jgi:hypothetical protein
MPSRLHESLLELFRNCPQLLPDLLRDTLRASLPRYTSVKVESADLSEVQPTEYRADLVMSLSNDEPVLGLVVEVQLSIDHRKRFVWPAYVANLRARWRCPVCLLVICTDRRVARWAETPTHIGCTNVFTPRVLSIDCVPEIRDEADAASNPELTVLSAIVHGPEADVSKAARMAAIAEGVCAKLDADRSNLYLDLVLSSLSEAARKVLQKVMRPDGYEYKSDFARRYMAEGRAEIVTRQLNARFGPLSEEVKKQIASRSSDELGAIADRLLTAASLEEALAPRS